MFKQFVALMRGSAFETAEATVDRHGITILRQQLRDCAAAIAAARKAVAIAIAQNGQELEQHRRIASRIEDLEARTVFALQQGKEGLAREAAETIARLEAERDASEQAQKAFHAEIDRLKHIVQSSESRLRELRRGERIAAATDSTQRLRSAASTSGLSALKDAEATLARLRNRQREIDATSSAIDEMEQSNDPAAMAERLAEAGCGAALKSSADDVLARLRQQLKPAA